ncbi:MAG: thiamine diphosphokinase [Kurthia sp.]|nr:thiamine diphosphokinase [Candidatus Kurthia equi]
MTTAIVVAGGPEEEIVLNDFLFAHDDLLYIGADHGAISLLNLEITPHAAVGDFDSLTKEEWTRIQACVKDVTGFQAEKDETDTELAILKALEARPDRIYITGVTGGRLDHYESNLHTVYRLQKKFPQIPMYIMNPTNCIQFLFEGTHRIKKEPFYKYLSFYPFRGNVENMTLDGVKYETKDVTIEVGSGRFTSNEITSDSATASFTKGCCLMIRSKD